MRHPKEIRKTLFGMTQKELAREVSRSQASVCEWEDRGAFPAAVIGEVRELGKRKFPTEWSDAWLFEVPQAEPAE